MDLEKYFAQEHTPSANSPVGSLMRRILTESPDMPFEQAREVAHSQLLKAATRKKFRVTTPGQDAKRLATLKSDVNATRETGISPYASKRASCPVADSVVV